MAEKQISTFLSRLDKLVANSCAVCVIFYIECIDLNEILTITNIIQQKQFLKFFYSYLRRKATTQEKHFKTFLLKKRVLKKMLYKLRKTILKKVASISRLRYD